MSQFLRSGMWAAVVGMILIGADRVCAEDTWGRPSKMDGELVMEKFLSQYPTDVHKDSDGKPFPFYRVVPGGDFLDWYYVTRPGQKKEICVRKSDVLTQSEITQYLKQAAGKPLKDEEIRDLVQSIPTATSDERLRLDRFREMQAHPRIEDYLTHIDYMSHDKRLDAAASTVKEFLQKHPENNAALSLQRYIAIAQSGKNEKMDGLYSMAIELSMLLRDSGNSKQFNEDLRRLNHGVAQHYIAKGDLKAAKIEVDTLVKEYPDFLEGLRAHAIVAIKQEDWKTASDDWENILKINPSREAYRARSMILIHNLHNPTDGLASAMKAYELAPARDGALMETIASLYAHRGDFDNALEFQSQALKTYHAESPAARAAKRRYKCYLTEQTADDVGEIPIAEVPDCR